MEKESFDDLVKDFFKALKEKTILIIIDSASKYDKAVFSLVSFKKNNPIENRFESFAPLLKELGFKNCKGEDELFITHCSGRFSLYILDNIGRELKGKGVKLPKTFYDWIQKQECI